MRSNKLRYFESHCLATVTTPMNNHLLSTKHCKGEPESREHALFGFSPFVQIISSVILIRD